MMSDGFEDMILEEEAMIYDFLKRTGPRQLKKLNGEIIPIIDLRPITWDCGLGSELLISPNYILKGWIHPRPWMPSRKSQLLFNGTKDKPILSINQR